jgi:hypothetical protein
MESWKFFLVGFCSVCFGTAVIVWPAQLQAASQRFEEGESMIPCPPLAGVPLWVVRLCGCIAGVAGMLCFYIFVAHA